MTDTAAIVEADPLPSPSRQTWHKAKRWSGLLAKFVSVQIVVQAIGLVTGIFLVRKLSQQQYAYFTIANTMQGTMSVLADSGISIALSAIGGKVWQDRYRFGQLINTALHLRKFLAGAAAVVVTPVLVWMLMKAGASAPYAVFVAAAVLLGLSAQLTTGVLEVVPRLHSQVGRLQAMDLYAALSRLALLAGALLATLNAAVAVLAASVSLLLKRSLLSRWVAGDVDTQAPVLQADKNEITGIVKTQLPNAIFYSIQGQITVWLISIFGNTTNIAVVGALGRLVVIFSVIGATMVGIVIPAFARSQSFEVIRRRFWNILLVHTALSLFLLALAVLFPSQLLWILGKQYSSYKSELDWLVLSFVVGNISSTIWALNAAKGWVRMAWIEVPLTITTQIMLLFILDLSSIKGAILFGLFSLLPTLIVNCYMSYSGLRQEQN